MIRAMEQNRNFREMVTRAGGIFVGVRGNLVLFRESPGGRTLSLFIAACRTVEDVHTRPESGARADQSATDLGTGRGSRGEVTPRLRVREVHRILNLSLIRRRGGNIE